VPPLTLIFLVLGSIITGVATVNQAGSIGAAGALIMGGYRLREGHKGAYTPAIITLVSLVAISIISTVYDINIKKIDTTRDVIGLVLAIVSVAFLLIGLFWSGWRTFKIEDTLRGVMVETAKTTSLVFIILLGAAMLTAAFRAFGGEDLVREFLNSLPGGFWSQFVIVMAVIFILGFFLDFIEIAVVVVPIVAPILLADPSANITAVWLGVMIGLNIQTSFLTPPFGFALFYLRGVAPAIVKTVQIYKGVIAFIGLQLLALGIVGYYPQLVNYLPNRVSLTGETAPPPRNPKLQLCLEDYVHGRLETERDILFASIDNARGLDVSVLPDQIAKGLGESFDDAENAVALLDEAFVAQVAVAAATDDYRPQLRLVRGLEKQMRKLQEQAEDIRKEAGFLTGESDAARRARLEARVEELLAERDSIAAKIPEDWDDTFAEFNKLISTENKARLSYRRAADGSYEAAAEFLSVMQANAAFFVLESDLAALEDIIAEADRETAENAVDALSKSFGALAGAGDVRSPLSKAKRSLREGKEDREKAAGEWAKAMAAYAEQAEWRRAAEGDLHAGIRAYLAEISDTVGARQQPRLNRDQALFIAGCNAGHRDISLNF